MQTIYVAVRPLMINIDNTQVEISIDEQMNENKKPSQLRKTYTHDMFKCLFHQIQILNACINY